MHHNYKVLGLALVAMLALGALAAQGAAAQPLTSESATTFLTGEQETLLEFKTAHGVVKCPTVTFSASTTGTTVNELTVAPNWPTEKAGGGSNCSAFGFANMHVQANGCTFTFTTPTKVVSGEVTWGTEQLHFLCPTGKSIEITPTSGGVSICTMFLAPQTPTAGHVVGTNVAGSNPMEATLNITLTGLHYTGNQAAGKGPCTDSTTHTEGTFTGPVEVKCFSNATHTTRTGCTFS